MVTASRLLNNFPFGKKIQNYNPRTFQTRELIRNIVQGRVLGPGSIHLQALLMLIDNLIYLINIDVKASNT